MFLNKEMDMKRLTVCILILTILSIGLTACNEIKVDDPSITIKCHATELSDDDYKSIGTEGLENPKKEDFRNIEFTLDVKHSEDITDRNIVVPDIKQVVIAKDPDRYRFGSYSQQDNPQENFAHYGYSFVLYTQGLDEQGIRDIFDSLDVRVAYTDKNDVYQEEVFMLSDILEFK